MKPDVLLEDCLMNENIISRNFETARKMKCYQKENIVYGTVKSIKPYGAFIEVSKNVVGLLQDHYYYQ